MGNKGSRQIGGANIINEKDNKYTKHMKFKTVTNYIAAKYITTASFQDLKNLQKPAYCNKLIILTSKIINKYLTSMNVDFLAQKTKKGAIINKMDKSPILYFDKSDLDKLDVSSHVKKKRICIGMAKFYVKIAHLFAAIATTINAKYTYNDDITNEEKEILLQQFNTLPLCARRISILKPHQKTQNRISVKSDNCNMNIKKTSSNIGGVEVPIPSLETKSLKDEIGIPELELLYFDDYDFTTGKYVGVTKEARESYYHDLEKFYQAFTNGLQFPNKIGIIVNRATNMAKEQINQHFKKYGQITFIDVQKNKAYVKFKNENSRNNALNDKIFKVSKWEIKSFTDIPLQDFHNHPLCKKNSPWLKSYTGRPTDKLFKEYAQHIQNMIHKSQTLEKSLLSVIKKLFAYWRDPVKREKVLTINPNLDEKLLQTLVEQTRETLLKLYVECEQDFNKGLSLFKAITDSKGIETSRRRIRNFQRKRDKMR